MRNEIYEDILNPLFLINPHLRELAEAPALKSYFIRALEWNPDSEIFPYKNWLLNRVVAEVKAVYGEKKAISVQHQLLRSFMIESGAHLNLPRSLDRVSKGGSPEENLNTLIFQGVILSVALNYIDGKRDHLSLSTGRIPPGNLNSAAYFEVLNGSSPIRILSNRWSDTPQSALPPLSTEQALALEKEIQKQIRESKAEPKAKALSYEMIEGLSQLLLAHDSFSDQIAALHSHFYNCVLKDTNCQQITLDYEPLLIEFLIVLLEDTSSLTYRIFSNSDLLAEFLELFADIKTGWKKGETPFDLLEKRENITRFSRMPYGGTLTPKSLVTSLREGVLLPKGVLQFFLLQVEGGLLAVGGMNQSVYCTEIRDRAARFLMRIGETKKAGILMKMPTPLTVITPAWGLTRSSVETRLLTFSDILKGQIRFDQNLLNSIAEIPGRDALLLASGALYHLLLKKPLDQSHLNTLYRGLIEEGKVQVFNT